MTQFILHTEESASVDSLSMFEPAQKAFGSIPNLIATVAESPAAIKAYLSLARAIIGFGH